ncbi:MAG: hypothetical protein AABX71_00895, partial [Nanoarchaeota archaeon]
MGASEFKFKKSDRQRDFKKILPGIQDLPRHPVFEIAEQAPVFLVNGKAYSLGESSPQGKNNDKDDFYEEKISQLKRTQQKRTSLVEIGDFNSLEALTLDRAKQGISKIGESYVADARKEIDALKKLDGELDTPQLIYKLVFPYLQDGHYRD